MTPTSQSIKVGCRELLEANFSSSLHNLFSLDLRFQVRKSLNAEALGCDNK